MTQLAPQATNATTALLEAQHSRFIKNMEYDLPIAQTDDGPVATVNGEEVPLLDIFFDLQIVQPGHVTQNKKLSSLVGKILVLYNKEEPDSEYAEELYLIPITILGYGQRNFGPYDTQEGKLLCYSMDGVTPAERVTAPLHHVCAEVVFRNGEYIRNLVCPHATWSDDKKPDCRTVVSLAFLDMERKVPVRLQLHGTGIGAWNQLQKAYKQARNVARLRKKSINDCIIKLYIRNEGTYMVPEFKVQEAPESLGRPIDWLPVCKYYMQTIFSRPTEDVSEVISSTVPAADAPELADATAINGAFGQSETDAEEFSL